MLAPSPDPIIKLALLAVGGQGGGVVTDWIVALAERSGWYAQSTSVPGVAQRTGATIYYVEMVPERDAAPVLALMPAPGDVDIVLAAELMEAGRAIMRGFVTPDRTTLITSTHRTLSVSEKIVPGSGIADPAPILDAARKSAKRFIGTDLDALASAQGSVISASLFGALAGSGVLPFARADFEAVIAEGGRGVKASLKAFAAGAAAVLQPAAEEASGAGAASVARGEGTPAGPRAALAKWDALTLRIARDLPAPAHAMLAAGLRKVVDFQDIAYGADYLDRLLALSQRDRASGGSAKGYVFTTEAAKHVANAMAYDDVIRVADLKTRTSRQARVAREMRKAGDQVLHVTEFMHPRLEEIAGTMPAPLGRFILARPRLARALDRVVNRGRHVRTDRVHVFLMLYALAGMRRFRRATLRHAGESAHRDAWLARAEATLPRDYDLAVEVLRARRLVKGYSDTHARGEAKFDKVMSAVPLLTGRPDAAAWLHRLIESALKDEDGTLLDGALQTVRSL